MWMRLPAWSEIIHGVNFSCMFNCPVLSLRESAAHDNIKDITKFCEATVEQGPRIPTILKRAGGWREQGRSVVLEEPCSFLFKPQVGGFYVCLGNKMLHPPQATP